jgi:hypothetical protein
MEEAFYTFISCYKQIPSEIFNHFTAKLKDEPWRFADQRYGQALINYCYSYGIRINNNALFFERDDEAAKKLSFFFINFDNEG